MRDYLNNKERPQLLYVNKYLDQVDTIISTWNNLTKEEKKNLKLARTYGHKAFESITNRLNDTALKTFINSLKSSYIKLIDNFTLDMYKRKFKSELQASYEENQDYYRLVELIMAFNCKDCNKHGADCEIYKEFELHCVPTPVMEDKENCKYAYELIEKGSD